MSYGEPIALRGQAEIKQVASAASANVRSAGEEEFLEKLKEGDAAAFERLVAERTGEIFTLLFRLTEDREEARDLTQETFLRAFQNINRFRGDAGVRTWLYRIALNQARNRWRWWKRRRRNTTVSLDRQLGERDQASWAQWAVSKDESPEDEALRREREMVLRSALRGIATVYREAVILRDVEGLSYEEIAEALAITIGTVKSRLSRGRLELRSRLEGYL